jgi:hypothetical protein
MTKRMACFGSASLLPVMLPLTSSTVTRSSGARGASASAAAAPGAVACTSTAKLSQDASLATGGNSQCVFSAISPTSGAWTAACATGSSSAYARGGGIAGAGTGCSTAGTSRHVALQSGQSRLTVGDAAVVEGVGALGHEDGLAAADLAEADGARVGGRASHGSGHEIDVVQIITQC